MDPNVDPQNFLTYYSELTNTSNSHEANRKLLEIESSQQSWLLAKSFILNHGSSQHGYQLLSKKLSKVYTRDMEDRMGICRFVLGLGKMNGMLLFCLAKLAIHLGWERLDLGPHTTALNILGILKQLPEAAAVITLPPQPDKSDNERARTQKLFTAYKTFLAEQFAFHPVQVLDCLQSFVNNNYKLQSEELVRLLLTRPIGEVSGILEEVLLGERYGGLSQEIYGFLVKNQGQGDAEDYFVVFLAFTRSLDLLNLNPETLTGILTQILSLLHKQSQSQPIDPLKKHSLLTDSFDMWLQLSNELIKARVNGLQSQQVQICRSAFVELWKIVVGRCLEVQMPRFGGKGKWKGGDGDGLEIVIDQEERDEELEMEVSSDGDGDDGVGNVSKFRQMGQDFLHMIFSTISKSQPQKNSCLSTVFQLTTNPSPLALQLSIFTLSSIIQIAPQNTIPQISTIIKSITGNPHAKDPYIWQQLIRLFGKLGHEAVADGDVFGVLLLVLREAMGVQGLAGLACENFCQVLTTCSNSSEKEKQIPILQQFMDQLYSSLYFKTQNKTLFQKLTKSSILFIYYFHPDLTYFQQFLLALNQKIEQLSSLEDKLQIIDNLALCHNYVASQTSGPFTPVLSQFFAAFLAVVVVYVRELQSQGKGKGEGKGKGRKLGEVFGQLGTIVSTGGGYHTDVWVQALIQLSQLPNVLQQKHLIINLFNKLLDISQHSPQYKPQLLPLLKHAIPLTTSSLLSSTQNQFKLVNRCLTFHFLILSKYIDGVQGYDPDPVLKFIVGRVFKGQWKFQLESSRTALGILRCVVAKGYRVQEILEQVLIVYPRIVDLLWKSLQANLYQAYKQGGTEVYKSALKSINPSMLPPNPLFQSLMQAIQTSNSKDFKNLLSHLK